MTTTPMNRRNRSMTAAIFLTAASLAFLLRAAVIHNDLWLDEVWSVRQAAAVDSPIDILARLHHDNNHHLNTLWLWLCGPAAGPLLQRSLSLLTGIAAVLLTGVLTLRWGRFAAAAAMLLTSVSILLVQYSTEARGYAPAWCMALAAHWCLRSHLANRHVWSGVGFGCLCVLGTLCHLSYLQYYFAAAFWSAGCLSKDQPGVVALCSRMLRCHAVAVIGLGALYIIDIRYLAFGGGPRLNAVSVMFNAVSVFAGGPLDQATRMLFFVAVCAGVIAGLWLISRDGNDEWKFFACLFLLFPVFRVVLLPAGLMFERYFLILLGFAAIPMGVLASRLFDGKRVHRLTLGLAATVFLSGNALHIGSLVQYGRGDYRSTMSMIGTESTDAIRISSDHPFRNRMLIEHFARECSSGQRVEYVELGGWINPPQWMICHHMPRDTQAPVNYFEPGGQPRSNIRVCGFPYELRSHTMTGELSGCEWLCYRLAVDSEQSSATIHPSMNALSPRTISMQVAAAAAPNPRMPDVGMAAGRTTTTDHDKPISR